MTTTSAVRIISKLSHSSAVARSRTSYSEANAIDVRGRACEVAEQLRPRDPGRQPAAKTRPARPVALGAVAALPDREGDAVAGGVGHRQPHHRDGVQPVARPRTAHLRPAGEGDPGHGDG